MLPALCHFFPSLSPEAFWRLRRDEYQALVTYRDDYLREASGGR